MQTVNRSLSLPRLSSALFRHAARPSMSNIVNVGRARFSASPKPEDDSTGFSNSPHFRNVVGHASLPDKSKAAAAAAAEEGAGAYVMKHAIYDPAEVEFIPVTHKDVDWRKYPGDAFAYSAVQMMRFGFDVASGYKFADKVTEKMLLTRMIFLETVAGVPGMVGGMTRHLWSLGLMRRDKGWINCLLAEAENERMHLLTFLKLREPGPLFRAAVLAAQAVIWPLYFGVYVVAPRTCHAFVGYLEEEAVITYSHAIRALDQGQLPEWTDMDAPNIAKEYWQLAPDAKLRDVLLAVRADEANHRDVNHALGSIKQNEPNPYAKVKE